MQWSGNLGLCVAGSGPSLHPAQPPGPRAARTGHPTARDRPPTQCFQPPSSLADPWATPSGVSAEPGDSQIPPQCPLAGRGSRDPGHPPVQLFPPLPALRGGGCPPYSLCPGQATALAALPGEGGARGTAANNETRRHGEAPTPPAVPLPAPAARLLRIPPPPKLVEGRSRPPCSPVVGGAGPGQSGLPTGAATVTQGMFPQRPTSAGFGAGGQGEEG